ncbi:MAG: orotate phosphoribosyltransferase [Polyangiaceae bacterium]
MRERLIAILRARSYERREVTLASGARSDFFIDCKQTVLTAEGHRLVGELMLKAVQSLGGCDVVAGVELGGCPLASAVSLTSALKGQPLDALYVRKDAKDHGTKKLVEGDKSLRVGTRVALLEDVITTGGSTLAAIAKLEDAGARVVGVVALVDREEGGRETITARGHRVIPIVRKSDLVDG